jgi:ACS family glucarate transporter-like MFS transporter
VSLLSDAPKIPRRYFVVTATFLLSFLLYVDRVCISTARGPILAEFKLSDAQFGWILSSFAFGYALFQTPAGDFADRRGARRALAIIAVGWSLFTGLTALAWNFVSLFTVRFLFGASEAGAFPGMARAAYSWIPMGERGLVKGINFSASRLGAAAAMPLLPSMIGALGWKKAFVVLMAAGMIWAFFWWRWFRDDPREIRGLATAERDFIVAHRQAPPPIGGAAALPLASLFTSLNLWLMMGQYFASNFVFFFSLSWLFPYVQKTYNLSYPAAGIWAMVPLLAGATGNLTSGLLVDALYRRGQSRLSRRLPAMLGFGLAAIGLAMSVGQTQVGVAVFWLSVALFGADMTLSPAWSFCIDLGGPHAGKVSGTMNMAGNLGSALVAVAFPYLLDWSGGPTAFFYLGGVLSIGGALAWLFINPARSFGHLTS